MGQGGWPALLGWALAAAASSALLTVLTIRYARRRLIDLPGQRRSHATPTPRGGGLAIVVAILGCVVVPAVVLARTQASDPSLTLWFTAALALLMVALVGWIDDHGGVRASVRFGVHSVAAAVVLGALIAGQSMLFPDLSATTAGSIATSLVLLSGLALAVVWSINLHNFMDGINGLLAWQSIFVFVVLGWLGVGAGTTLAWSASFLLAASVLGFAPFNFPRARIFLGDVGSGALGLLVALVALAALLDPALDGAVALVACSAFVTDATATLLSRMLRGRRWYSAHREHLYQWLVRSGYRHASVVGFYMGWNLVVVIPAVLLIASHRSAMSTEPVVLNLSTRGLLVTGLVYALAVAAWVIGKRWSLAQARAGRSHGIA